MHTCVRACDCRRVLQGAGRATAADPPRLRGCAKMTSAAPGAYLIPPLPLEEKDTVSIAFKYT